MVGNAVLGGKSAALSQTDSSYKEDKQIKQQPDVI